MKQKKAPFGKKESVSSRQEVWIAFAPYLKDLASSDYFLIPNLKKGLGAKRYDNNEEVEFERLHEAFVYKDLILKICEYWMAYYIFYVFIYTLFQKNVCLTVFSAHLTVSKSRTVDF